MGDLKELKKEIDEISKIAKSFGLDPFEMRYEICPQKVIQTFASYIMPSRYSHWSFGKAFQKRKFDYEIGFERILELVINTDPTYAFLVDGNSFIENKVLIAHVIAHSDFFKNNINFKNTSKNMLLAMKRNAERIKYYEKKYGKLNVEHLLNTVLAIQEHINPSLHNNMDSNNILYINKDLLLYIQKFSNSLKDWQRDVLRIIREEMKYFWPQLETKLINEGWATYWYVRILRELKLTEEETIEYAKLHSSIIKPSSNNLNPYLVGLRIFEDIENRWNRDKIFEVRKLDTDISLIRNYLTKEIIQQLDIFVYQKKSNKWVIVEKDWKKVKEQIVQQNVHCGFPSIYVSANESLSSSELYLIHQFDGIELDIYNIEKVLPYIYLLWGNVVHLETIIENKKVLFSYDGKNRLRKIL